jgi:hypothetical protein
MRSQERLRAGGGGKDGSKPELAGGEFADNGDCGAVSMDMGSIPVAVLGVKVSITAGMLQESKKGEDMRTYLILRTERFRGKFRPRELCLTWEASRHGFQAASQWEEDR